MSTTKRTTVSGMESFIGQSIPVLDYGFIQVVDYMGDDNAVCEAARVSYANSGATKTSSNEGLIRYLLRNQHTSPFEMCEIKLHIKLPLFVARQWIRHRTASVNEISGRYSILKREFYLPSPQVIAPQSTANHQGRSQQCVSFEDAQKVLKILETDALMCYEHYEELNEGVAKEIARMNLPLNFYTEWYWKINVHNLLRFLHLRMDEKAQYEIRVYAHAIFSILKEWMPITTAAFEEYGVKGLTLSKTAIQVIRDIIQGKDVKQEESGLTKREWKDMVEPLLKN
jgi:thymidylate synthase (FAD)